MEYVADRAETTATVWLGLTVGCARCHDHKYDPISQKDFYQLFAFFNNMPDEQGFVYNFGNEEPFVKAPLPDQEKRLAELDRKLADQREALCDALQPKLRTAPSGIGRSVRGPAAADWTADAAIWSSAPRRASRARSTATPRDFNYRDPFTFAARIKPESREWRDPLAPARIISRARGRRFI